MTTSIEIKDIDVEAELKIYDAEQAKKANEERNKKVAELKRKAKINEELKIILQEKDVSIISDTVNALLPFLTANLEHADLSLVSELVEKAVEKAGEKVPVSKSKSTNDNKIFLIVDSKKMLKEKPELHKSLVTKTGVDFLKENKDYLVVTKKNYGTKFTKLVIESGFEAIPKAKGKPEVSATAVALKSFTLRSKKVDINKVSFNDALEKELTFFEEVSE